MSENKFDIAAFEAADTSLLNVLDIRGDPLFVDGNVVTIELYGPGSNEYAKAQARLNDILTSRSFMAMRGKPVRETMEESRAPLVDKYVACTKALNNFPIEGGARALYENPKLTYITDQVARFIEDWANFTPGSATT